MVNDARQAPVSLVALTRINCRNERGLALTRFRNRKTRPACTGIASHSRYSFGIQDTMDEGLAGDVEVGGALHQATSRLQLYPRLQE